MDNLLTSQNKLIKQEADDILFDKGLFSLLRAYGTPHVSGSYALDLMTWRDLDIYLQVDNFSLTNFFELGNQICTAFTPPKMSFRNELIAKTEGLPLGLYWGIYLGNERAGAWKIDIWAVSSWECHRLITFCNTIKEQLTPETTEVILDIKAQCWKDPAYRRSYNSTDIYSAVLEKDIRTLEAFRQYLADKKASL